MIVAGQGFIVHSISGNRMDTKPVACNKACTYIITTSIYHIVKVTVVVYSNYKNLKYIMMLLSTDQKRNN